MRWFGALMHGPVVSSSPLSPPAQPQETTTRRGRRAELLARDYLSRHGYRLIAVNFECPGGELDIVAYEGEVLCFIEVRARSSVLFGHPLETIGPRKIRRIVRAASAYLSHVPTPWPPMRFDALGIVLLDPPLYTLVRAAFEAF